MQSDKGRDAKPWHFWSAPAPAPASAPAPSKTFRRLRLRLRWSSPHMSLYQQYDFQKCQMSKYDFLPTWPWVWMRLWMRVFEICHSLASKATAWHSRGHSLLRVALSELSGFGPKWPFATDTRRILNIRRRISPRWRFWSVACRVVLDSWINGNMIQVTSL